MLVTFLVFSLLLGSWGRDDRPPTTTIAEAQEEAAAAQIEAVKKAVILRRGTEGRAVPKTINRREVKIFLETEGRAAGRCSGNPRWLVEALRS